MFGCSDPSLEQELKDLLYEIRLPLNTPTETSEIQASCSKYFLSTALNAFKQPVIKRNDLWSFDGIYADETSSISATHLLTGPDEQTRRLLISLQALAKISAQPGNCGSIDSAKSRKLLHKIYQLHGQSKSFQEIVLRILGNLAFCNQGPLDKEWRVTLSNALEDSDLALASSASRVVSNTGDNDTLADGVYCCHPLQKPLGTTDSDHTEETLSNTNVDSPGEGSLEFDIVFVHGLLGGPFYSWRQNDASKAVSESYTKFWPKDWLAKDLPNSRMLAVEYESHLTDWKPICPIETDKLTLAYRTNELLNRLSQSGLGQRPIIWVGHSFGGILIKSLLCSAASSAQYNHLANATRGVVFYSVPHKGIPPGWYNDPRRRYRLLHPSTHVQELREDSPQLLTLNHFFVGLAQQRKWDILSFGESRPSYLGMNMKLLVVPTKSADIQIGDFHELPERHLATNKPHLKSDEMYKTVLNFVKRIVHKEVFRKPTDSNAALIEQIALRTVFLESG